MTQYIIAYIATAISFAVIDLIWLGVVARNFYWDRLGDLLEINIVGAVLFYVMYITGIIYFAVGPGLSMGGEGVWKNVLVMGCIFGFFAYATYDLTNLATIKGWPYSIVIVDIIWGTILTGSSATIGYLITKSITG